MRILITGPQGSGKSTQAEILAKKLGYQFFSLGDRLREIENEDSPRGQSLRETVAKGELAPNDLAAEVVKETMESVKGIVADGYPRTLDQIRLYDPEYDQVFYLEIPKEIAVERLLKRGREDDSLEKINKRLEWYYQETEPILEYFRKQGKLVNINGNQEVEEVAEEIFGKVKV